MQRSRRLSLIIAAILSLGAVATFAAQARSHQESRERDRSAAAAPAPISIDFKGGNGAQYVEMIRSAAPDANIVVMGEIDKVIMGPVRLRNVDLASALRVFNALPRQYPGYDAKVDVGEIRTHPERSAVHTLAAMIEPRERPRALTQHTNVISLADLLGDDLKPADALAAIETALNLGKGDAAPAEIRFHEETGLLICRGSPEQIEAIRQVIEQLRERANTLRARREAAAFAEHQSRQAQVNTREVQEARREAEALRQELTRAQTRGEMLEREVAKLQHVVTSLEEEARALRAMAQEAKGGGS